MKPAVFFDRDGTLIRDRDYLDDPDDVEWYNGAMEAIRNLRNGGFEIVIVTNQSGVARGLFNEETVRNIHDRMRRDLTEEGISPPYFYYCPYLEDATVEEYRKDSYFRKPSPGMLLQASEDHNLDLPASYMVGDKQSDLKAGHRAGTATILLRTGKAEGMTQDELNEMNPDKILPEISGVASFILEDSGPY